MKSRFIDLHNATTFFLLLVLALVGPAHAQKEPALTLSQPADWQVFQRRTEAVGTIHLVGRITEAEATAIEWRLTGSSVTEARARDWQGLAAPRGTTVFEADLEVPAGGWYGLEVRALHNGSAVGSVRVEHVGVGEVFVVAGQSNAANHGSERQQTVTGLVSSFDGTSWRLAQDPQPGASGRGGSFMPAFGDALAGQFKVPVGLVPLGVGSTSVREWLPKGQKVDHLTTTGHGLVAVAPGQWESVGTHFATLSARLGQLGPRGCRALLWHQGESDAGQARAGYPVERQISGNDYTRYLNAIIGASRRSAGWELPWFVAQTTYHNEADPADEEFRAAQRSVCDKKLTWPGPDTDELQSKYMDAVHFNASGLRRHGELWAGKVGPFLQAQFPQTP